MRASFLALEPEITAKVCLRGLRVYEFPMLAILVKVRVGDRPRPKP